jgi:hypothetical protein
MALSFTKQPAPICFSSMIGVVEITSDEDVSVVISADGSPVLTESYTPDANGKIRILGLYDLILPFISKTSLRSLVEINATGATSNNYCYTDTWAIYCTLVIPNTVMADFFNTQFLTALKGVKQTHYGQMESLSITQQDGQTSADIEIIARYSDGSQRSFTQPASGAAVIQTFDIGGMVWTNSANFPDPENIDYFAVNCGDRHFTYFVRPRKPESIQFKFLNPFGVYETFIPRGIISRENKYDDTFGTIEGNYKKVDSRTVKEYTANSGFMTEDEADWLEGMIDSPEVSIIDLYGADVPVVITSATVKRSDARDALPSIEFKYRLQRENHAELRLPTASEIFDDSFSYQFN